MVAPASNVSKVVLGSYEQSTDLLRIQARDEKRREFIKDIVKTALFAVGTAILIGLAVASAPVGGALAFGIIAGVCATVTIGGIISVRNRWLELQDLAK